MGKYILKRLVALFVVLVIVSIFCFWLIQLLPGDPCIKILGTSYTPETYHQCVIDHGFNQPLINQYFIWLNKVLHGDLGYSYVTNIPVSTMIGNYYWVTVELVILSQIFALAVAIPLAIRASVKPNGFFDRFSTTTTFVLLAIPTFAVLPFLTRYLTVGDPVGVQVILMALIALVFAVLVLALIALVMSVVNALARKKDRMATRPELPMGKIFVFSTAGFFVLFILLSKGMSVTTFNTLFNPNRWFQGPGNTYVPLFTNPIANVHNLTLGALAIGIPSIAGHYRFLRGDMIYNLQEDFVLMARSKGLTNSRILTRHVFRPSSVTLIASTALTVSGLIAGAIVVETYLAIPGVGQNLISSLFQSDYVAIQAIVLVLAATTVIVNFVADFLLTVVDPRIARD